MHSYTFSNKEENKHSNKSSEVECQNTVIIHEFEITSE